jgi:pyridoxine 5-phosphate synthase
MAGIDGFVRPRYTPALMLRLGVNIDHVATVRQARRAQEPDPVHAAVLAELGGADGITVHLRGDRRHIQDRDVEVLRQTVRTRLNVEMAATQEMTRVALTVKPQQATLVPERREELTTEGGLDVVLNSVQVRPMVKTLQEAGIEVSLFVDPELEQVKEAHKLDAHAIEINTAAWSEARDERAREAALRRLVDTARFARKLGLAVHGGHGLTYENVGPVAAIGELVELNIGHSIVARALLVGMERAVREMRDALAAARAPRV